MVLPLITASLTRTSYATKTGAGPNSTYPNSPLIESSANFRFTAFSEVRTGLWSVASFQWIMVEW